MNLRILIVALLLSIVGGCNLIFKYEDRESLDSGEDGALDRGADQELGPAMDGPDFTDWAILDLERPDRALVDLLNQDQNKLDQNMSDQSNQDQNKSDQNKLDQNKSDQNKSDQYKPDKYKPDQYKPPPDLGCLPPTTSCGGVCVSLLISMKHCGKCKAPCSTLTADRCLVGNCSCGLSGAPCVGGLNCKGGKCVCQKGGLCGGCCDGATCRAPGATQSLSKCGKGGNLCVNCNDSNDCTADACSVSGSCTKTNRANGTVCNNKTGRCAGGACCFGCRSGSTCYAGTSLSKCGDKGGTCANCPTVTSCRKAVCSSSGVCLAENQLNGTSCNSGAGKCVAGACCSGCNNGTACATGTSHYVCGKGGINCQNCASKGWLCTNNVCSPGVTCGSLNCSDGCCKGNLCIKYAGQNDATCGLFGAVCAPCSSFQTCKTGQCK